MTFSSLWQSADIRLTISPSVVVFLASLLIVSDCAPGHKTQHGVNVDNDTDCLMTTVKNKIGYCRKTIDETIRVYKIVVEEQY